MNEIIKNFSTGDSIEFLQTDKGTDGRMSNFIMTLAPYSSWAKSPRHFHPYQTETFKVIEGELNLSVGDKKYKLTPDDDKVVVDKFVLHSFWNATGEEVKFIAEIYPPKNIEKGIRLNIQCTSTIETTDLNDAPIFNEVLALKINIDPQIGEYLVEFSTINFIKTQK